MYLILRLYLKYLMSLLCLIYRFLRFDLRCLLNLKYLKYLLCLKYRFHLNH